MSGFWVSSVFSEPDSVPNQEQKPLFEESTPTKPVQSVAPQVREPSGSSVWESGSDNLVDLWDGGSEPQTAKPSSLVELMDDVTQDEAPPSTAATGAKPQSLLSFDELMDGTFCSGPEDEPASLVDLTAPDQMTLSYQHALQHASGEELEDGQLLMTNGETLLKEGTQVRTLLDFKGGFSAGFCNLGTDFFVFTGERGIFQPITGGRVWPIGRVLSQACTSLL